MDETNEGSPLQQDASRGLIPGTAVVIRTPDRREYRGALLEIGDARRAVIRLDTGWVTSFPIVMVHPDDRTAGQNL